jgi:hypothetical protein
LNSGEPPSGVHLQSNSNTPSIPVSSTTGRSHRPVRLCAKGRHRDANAGESPEPRSKSHRMRPPGMGFS